jgi:hypothetical protein
VSKGEISPKDGQLEIAMLKVRYQHANEPGLEPAGPASHQYDSYEAPPREAPPFGRRMPINAPIAFAILLPLVLIGGVMLGGLALFLALPTYVLVTVWNQVAPAQHWPLLAYWPTLGVLMVLFAVLTVTRWTRRLRVIFNRPS